MNNIIKGILGIGTLLIGSEIYKNMGKVGSRSLNASFFTLPINEQVAYIQQFISKINAGSSDNCYAPKDMVERGLATSGRICPSDIAAALGIFLPSPRAKQLLNTLDQDAIQGLLIEHSSKLQQLRSSAEGLDFFGPEQIKSIYLSSANFKSILILSNSNLFRSSPFKVLPEGNLNF